MNLKSKIQNLKWAGFYAIPAMGSNGWYAQGLVFAASEIESPLVEIKRLGPRDPSFATKEDAEQYALELCRAWIDERHKQK